MIRGGILQYVLGACSAQCFCLEIWLRFGSMEVLEREEAVS